MAAKRPARPHIREIHCAPLPPEVWINIFSYHPDLPHLWITCRRVSSTLRACAEYAFGDFFLKDIHIDFQLEKYNLGGKSKRPEVPVVFNRLGKRDEKDIAWFRHKRDKGDLGSGRGKNAQEQHNRVMLRWEENVKGWKPEMPNYTISIRGLVNDTALPGLRIDMTEGEIRFEWRKMLHLFYREHEQLRIQKDAWQTKTAKKMQANKTRLAKGEKLIPSDYPCPWSTAEADIRKDIRRARLKEHYSVDEQMVWAIDSLKHFENYGAANGNPKAFKLNPDIPGAGLGEKWSGSTNLVQGLYLDEWSCMHRIDTKVEHLRGGQ